MTWQTYRRVGTVKARPLAPGDDLAQVSVDVGYTPKLGDMIATDDKTQWLIQRAYFEKHYEPLDPA